MADAVDYRMLDHAVYLVNPVRQSRRRQKCITSLAALRWITRRADDAGRTVRQRVVRPHPNHSGIAIAEVYLPDADGVGYWHASVWWER